MDWLWVVIPAFLVAVATVLDGRFFTAYFSWAELMFDFSAVSKHGRSAVGNTITRRLVYPFTVGFGLNLLFGRPQVESLGVGFLAICVLLWPVFTIGLPTHLTGGKRGRLILFYMALILLYSMASWLGAFAGQALGSLDNFLAFLTDQTISLLIALAVTAFSSAGLSSSMKSS